MKKKKKNSVIHVEFNNPTIREAEHYVRMVAQDSLRGCILIGPPGMGKTHTVTTVLDELDVEYIQYGGHITLAEIYEFLWENHDKLIFFDDVSQVVNKVEIMEMLKQALNTSGSREISYRSKNVLSEAVPNHFEFTGRVIFAFNVMDTQNGNVKAIIDRCPSIEMKYSRGEIIEAMYKVAAHDTAGGLMKHEKMIVTKEIETYTDSTMHISLRAQHNAFQIYNGMKTALGNGNKEWKALVHKIFGKKKKAWIQVMLADLCGETGKIKAVDFVREVALNKDVSYRTAYRRLEDAIGCEWIYRNKGNGGYVSLKPFGVK